MELLGRIRNEIQRAGRSANVPTRVAAVAAVVVAAVMFYRWAMRSSTGELVPVADTAGWTGGQSAAVRDAIHEAGLPEPHERDGQLFVPETERDRYQSVIANGADEPRTWAETWEDANSTLSHFSLSSERNDVREISRAKLTSRLLNELPGVEQADVVWDEERQPGWNRPPLVRATVYLKPRPGRRITLETVHAVRLAVAGSKAYLDPEDVVVVDLSRMAAFDQEALGADFASRYGQITRLSAEYRQRAEDILADIPGVSVTVDVEPVRDGGPEDASHSFPSGQFETTASRSRAGGGFEQEQPNTGLEIPVEPILEETAVVAESTIPIAGMESSNAGLQYNVSVSIAIPTAHFYRIGVAREVLPAASHAEASRLLDAIEQEVSSDVRGRLAGLATQINPAHARQTVTVESVESDPIAPELLVAASAPEKSPKAAAILSRSRTTLVALTVLMSCWLLWTVIQRFASRLGNEPSAAYPEAPEATSVHHYSEAAALESEADAEETTPLMSELPAERLSEILTADQDGIVLDDVIPGTRANRQVPEEKSYGSSPTATPAPVNRLPTCETGSWDIDELAELPDAQLRRLVRSVAIDVWPAALSSATPSTRRRLLSALPDGEAEQLREVLHHVRPVRLADIDFAQREVQTALASC